MEKRRLFVVFAVLSFVSIFFTCCKESDPDEVTIVRVKSLTLNNGIADGISLPLGGTLELGNKVSILPINATNKQKSFTSSDTDVAVVDRDGLVAAKYPGTAKITITADQTSVSFTLTVVKYPEGINPRLMPVGMNAHSKNTINTTVFRQNSIVTHGNDQYISFYDENSYLVIGKRQLGNSIWTWQRSQYTGGTGDAHRSISIMVDGDGYLHVSFDHHDTGLRYCKSTAPGSLALGVLGAMTGVDENQVSYPEFYRFADGDLLFAYRKGISGGGNLVLNYYRLATKQWTRVQSVVVDGEGVRNAYWQLCIDKQGTIHLSWVWRETPDVSSNHDMCYARSRDRGATWEKSDGTSYVMPIKLATSEVVCEIPRNSELINQTSMVADDNGKPYIASYWREAGSSVPQYCLVWFDGSAWKQQQIGRRYTPFSLSGGGTRKIPISRPRLAIANRDGKNYGFCVFRDSERDSRVSVAYTADVTSGKWDVFDMTDFPVDDWEPSHDTQLWVEQNKLHVYVQRTGQADGDEQSSDLLPQPVYVLEVN